MDLVVILKQVPDTATRIQDRVRQGRLDLDGVTWVANPYDEYAVEECLRLRERHGGTVTLMALGPDRVQSALKDMLALGCDEAVHLWDPAFADLDARGRAAVLAAALRQRPYTMIWAGWKSVDDDEGAVPIYLARALGLPHVAYVVGIEVTGESATLRREVEGGHEVIETPLPAVLTAQKGLNDVRYASLKGIMAVKRKEIPVLDASALGLDTAALPTRGIEEVHLAPPPDRPPGKLLKGKPSETAAELVRLLHEEAKVI